MLGAQGVKGGVGRKGAPGPVGAQGVRGDDGVVGAPGDTGLQVRGGAVDHVFVRVVYLTYRVTQERTESQETKGQLDSL